jgi:arabinoxylan arabinofuranohydrolase
MKQKTITTLATCLFSILTASAQNPIIQTKYTCDPAPMVYGDTLYLYVDHDEDETPDGFNMKDWLLYKTTDMVNWTDCGVIANLATFPWGDQNNGAWALQCVPRNGKFYLYCPIQLHGIGVAVADNPNGPFTDAIGGPIINQDYTDIDPTAFVDDDGQAYLYWANPKNKHVVLNEDMISYKDTICITDPQPDNYTEGPWIYKRNGIYYLVYASHGIPEKLSYATSTSPLGPWTYQGIIMETFDGAAFTNHPGVVDFKGHSYLFYHDQRLSVTNGFQRSVSVEEFTYGEDGSIPLVTATTEGITNALANVDPYKRVEAETMAWSEGLRTNGTLYDGGVYVDSISDGDYIKVRNVDFGSDGAAMFTARVACSSNGGTIEVHAGAKDGTLLGTLRVNYTGGEWATDATSLTGATGVNDLYLVFHGDADSKALFKFDAWKLTAKTADRQLIGLDASTDAYDLDITTGANTATYSVKAIYSDGTTEDVTSEAQAAYSVDGLCSASNGTLTAQAYGNTAVTFTYQGQSDVLNYVIENMDNKLTVGSIRFDPTELVISEGGLATFQCFAVYKDGHEENLLNKATFVSSNTDVVSVKNDTIRGLSVGEASISVTYQGKLGDAVTASLPVTVEENKFFPLDAVNPNIFSEGTYDSTNYVLTTGQYGFGGWTYETPIDLTPYSAIVIELQEQQSCGAEWRMFDENNYWSTPTITPIGSNLTTTINLDSLTKDGGTDFDRSHVYIAGFWSYGGNPIKLKSITLVKSSTGISDVVLSQETKDRLPVYNLSGQLVGRYSDMQALPKGIYIVNGKKIIK